VPTNYKPQLDHVGFDWTEHSERIYSALLARKDQILDKSGFNKEFDCIPLSATRIVRTEADYLIDEIGGILALAASVQLDAGYKAVNRIIATLRAVEKDPDVVRSRNIEPEALGMIAGCYQRGDEPPGTFWYDVYQQDCAEPFERSHIERAATQAVEELQSGMIKGRPAKEVFKVLAKLRGIYLRFNDTAGRRSVITSINGVYSQVESGPFLEFLELVIEPLNQFFATIPSCAQASISAVQVARYREAASSVVQRKPIAAYLPTTPRPLSWAMQFQIKILREFRRGFL
jgi:hypothetical protein